MNRTIFLIALIVFYHIGIYAQATKMTVNIDEPGTLPSIISYENQQTIQELNVSGYINSQDLHFIGSLMNKSLKRLDLEAANIVDSDTTKNNICQKNMFANGGTLERLSLPLSITKITKGCFNQSLDIDTLIVGGPNLPELANDFYQEYEYKIPITSSTYFKSHRGYIYDHVTCLILREGTISIKEKCFNGFSANVGKRLSHVSLPQSLQSIGEEAFYGGWEENSSGSLSKNSPLKITFSPNNNIEYLGARAFFNYSDTIFLPNLSTFHHAAFRVKLNTTRTFFVLDQVSTIDFDGEGSLMYNAIIYTRSLLPPSIINCGSQSTLFWNSTIVYVPKGAKPYYETASWWSNATIIEDNPVEKITIEADNKYYIGDIVSLRAKIEPSDATNPNITWNSSNQDIATISDSGVLTAHNCGKTTITASAPFDRIEATHEINVYAHTTSVLLSDTLLKLKIGNTQQLNAHTFPVNISDDEIYWNSSNEGIATVNQQGIVTGISRGTCTITVHTVDGNHTAQCKITVYQPVESLVLEKHNTTLNVGNEELLIAVITPTISDNKNLIWNSSNDEIATVDERGFVTALKSGNTYIKAVSEENSEAKDSCYLTVLQPVSGITLNETSLTLNAIGESITLEATVLPEDASNKEIRWSSSNESVCFVSHGTVVATGYGVCVVLASTEDGNYTAACTVTVNNASGISDYQIRPEDGHYTIYDLLGRQLNEFKPGVNIIRFANGNTKKVVITNLTM